MTPYGLTERCITFAEWLERRLSAAHGCVGILVLVLLTAPFFRPEIVIHIDNPIPALVYKYWGLTAVCISVAAAFVFVQKRVFLVVMGLFVLTALCSTVLNGGSFETWAVRWLSCFGVVCLAAASQRLCPRAFLWALFIVTAATEALNFSSVLLFPKGLWATDMVGEGANFFFDHRNNAYRVLLPLLLSSCLLDARHLRRFSLRTALVLVVAYLQVVLAPSVTSLLALLLATVLLFLVRFRACRRWINGISVSVASVVAFLLVVVARMQVLLGPFIEEVLGKSITLTGRTEIWDFVFQLVDVDNVLLGFGVSGHAKLVLEGVKYAHAHNQYLDVWLNGGLLTLALMVILIALAAWSMYRRRTVYPIAVLAAVLCAYCLIGITETLVCPSFFLVLSLGYYASLRWPLKRSARPQHAR